MEVEIVNTDIAIVGGGGTGLCAGVQALQSGAKDVTIIEMRNNTGGNTQYAYGFFASDSPLQHELGIWDTNDYWFRVAMDYAQWQINPDVMRSYIGISGDTVQWLMDMGIKVELNELVRTQFGMTIPKNWHKIVDVAARPGTVQLGSGATRVLRDKFEELGGHVITKTRGRKLLKDENGKITGVLCTSRGKRIQVNAKAVILGTGGYGGSPEMMAKYHEYYTPESVITYYPVHCEGDGLNMALEAGADSEGLGRIMIEPKGWADAPRQMWIMAVQQQSVWLDKRGQRFCDEGTYIDRGAGGFQVILQLWRKYHDMTNYTVFDHGMMERVIKFQDNPMLKHYHYQRLDQGFDLTDKGINEVVQREVEKGNMMCSDNWADIAKFMGIPAEDLQKTIDEYNASCHAGVDHLFCKDRKNLYALEKGPFYCIKNKPRYLNPMGGVKIDGKMRAVDYNGEVIPGLFCGGIDAGGWEGDGYNILINGTFFSFALNSGRLAGKAATEYVYGDKE